MDGKNPLLSKTLWFNSLALVLVIAKQYGYAEFVPDDLVGPLSVVIMAAVNLGLRLITRQPLAISHPTAPAEV